MNVKVLIAHAPGEEGLAEQLGESLHRAGYDVAHRGTVLVGESIIADASRLLASGSPLIVCGTVRALGTRWARLLVRAARAHSDSRVFALQVEEEADIEAVAFDEVVARYWEDPERAMQRLVEALQAHYPSGGGLRSQAGLLAAETRYRDLSLQSCDIIDLASLPEDRHIAARHFELRRLYVPLRVSREVHAIDAPEALLKALEERHQSQKRSNAGWREGLPHPKPDSSVTSSSVGELLKQSPRAVILGDPGSGKSTLLRWIATAYLLRAKGGREWGDLPDVSTLPNEDLFPILVRCRDLDQSCLTGVLDDVLHHTLRKTELSESECETLQHIVVDKLQSGTALLLIDGLDEVRDPRIRAGFARQLEQVGLAYPRARVMVSSRLVGYREMQFRLGHGFEHVVMAELTRDEKDDFARRWCRITELHERVETATRDLIRSIHSTDRIERMTSNPLLLTTMALVKRRVGELPRRRVDLYWEAVSVLLNWRREVDEPLDTREAIPQLEYLAFAMCDRGVQQLREDQILELLENVRREHPQLQAVRRHTCAELLLLLEGRTGLLGQVGYERYQAESVPLFEFRHLTFQEYLAGKALVTGRFPGHRKNSELAEYVGPLAGRIKAPTGSAPRGDPVVADPWREALRLCIASVDGDVDDTLAAIMYPMSGEDASITARPRAVEATLCLADEPNVSETLAQQLLENLIRHVDGRDGRGIYGSSLDRATIELVGSRWQEVLVRLLLTEYERRVGFDREPIANVVASIEAAELRASGNGAYLSWVDGHLDVLRTGGYKAVLSAALALWGERSAAPYQTASGKANEAWRRMVASGDALVSHLSSPGPVAHVIARLIENLSDGTLLRGRFSRWWPTRAQVQTMLGAAADGETDPGAVRALLGILDALGCEAAMLPTLLRRLQDPYSEVRAASVRGFRELRSREAKSAQISALADQSEAVRLAALESLGGVIDERVRKAAMQFVNNPVTQVRIAALDALAAFMDESSHSEIVNALEDPDLEIRQAAVWAADGVLWRLSSNARNLSARSRRRRTFLIEMLIGKLDDLEPRMRGAAASAISSVRSQQALKALLSHHKDRESSVRSSIVTALSRFQGPRVLDALLISCGDKAPQVRRVAVAGLRERQDPRIPKARDALRKRLSDHDSAVRLRAAATLAAYGDLEAAKVVAIALNHREARIREIALQEVGLVHREQTIDVFATALIDVDSQIRYQASRRLMSVFTRSALRPANEQNCIGALLSALVDDDPNVRAASAIALGALGRSEAANAMVDLIGSPYAEDRRGALMGLAALYGDQTDRVLLSEDSDGLRPFWDPLTPVDEDLVRAASAAVQLSPLEVRVRYEQLALRVPLKLTWMSSTFGS